MAWCAHLSHPWHCLQFVSLILFLEPLGGAGALWTLSFSLPHPCNIMWDEGNCYGKLNEIKRENSFIHLCRVWFQSCLCDGAAPMASESGGRDKQLPRTWWEPNIWASSLSCQSIPPCTYLLSSFFIFSVQGHWPFNYPSNSEHTNLCPQFPGVCACFSLCALGAWRVCSSVHIVRLSIGSRTQWPPTSWVSLLNWN